MNETGITEVVSYSTAAYSVILAVFGFAGTFITQVVKKLAKQDGNRALLVSGAVSVALSVAAMAVAGDFSGQSLAQGVASIFALSTVVYRLVLSNDRIINPEV